MTNPTEEENPVDPSRRDALIGAAVYALGGLAGGGIYGAKAGGDSAVARFDEQHPQSAHPDPAARDKYEAARFSAQKDGASNGMALGEAAGAVAGAAMGLASYQDSEQARKIEKEKSASDFAGQIR